MSAFLTKPSIGKQFVNEIRQVALKNRTLIDEDLLEELKEAFTLFDTNHNGSIDARELKAALRALGHTEITKQQCAEMFREVDKEPSATLNFDEFCKVMQHRMREKDPRDEAMKVFQLFDSDKTGKITFKNLKKVALDVGENFSDKELHEMLNEADRSGDGQITFDEFFRVMRKKCNDPMAEFDSDEDF
jgi:centrin-1